MQRELLHTRSIELQGYGRTDGLYELEARLIDRKSYDSRRFPDDVLPAGEPLHDMAVQMTFDEDLLIHEFKATMAATPHDGCREAEPNFALAGLKIEAGVPARSEPPRRGRERLHASARDAAAGRNHCIPDGGRRAAAQTEHAPGCSGDEAEADRQMHRLSRRRRVGQGALAGIPSAGMTRAERGHRACRGGA